MRQCPCKNPFSPRWPSAILAAILAFTGVRDISEGSGAVKIVEEGWTTGRSVAIAVESGRARFTVPSAKATSQTLLIVSSLAQTAREFPIRVTSRAVASAALQPPPRKVDQPRIRKSSPKADLPRIPEAVATTPPRERAFHLMARAGDVASASNYLAVNGILKGFGARVQVYVDEGDHGQVDQETVNDIIATFDAKVFPVAASTFGQARDVDADGRFTVLLSSWLSRLGGGRNAVDGFVRGADLDLALPSPFSNHCDMMYLNASLKSGPHLRTVVAHEYTHAVTFSVKAFQAGDGKYVGHEEEGWIDEALAHLVEDLHGFSRTNIDYRVSGFLSRPEAYRLVVDDYYAADLFRSHGNRGGTYLFLRWCADRYGPGLIAALIRSDKKGIANLEAATGRPFNELFREWTVALFMTGFDRRPAKERERIPFSNDTRPIDDWELAGPRTHRVKAGGEAELWSSAGTASRYILIEGSPTGAIEVTVDAPTSAMLQVTAVPLPDDLAGLDFEVKATVSVDGHPALRATLRERDGMAVRLSAMTWEPAVPSADPHAPGFRRAGLERREIAATFGADTLPAFGLVESKPIASAGALPRISPLVVKVIGTDAKGRRVAAWADLVPNEANEIESDLTGDGG